MLANFLIGLREGLEAALVVSILVAYLVKTGRRDRLASIWAGVGAAVALSIGVGGLLAYSTSSLSFTAQESLGGSLSILAVGLVTWMVFWMRRTARHLKRDIEGRVDSALTAGALALALVAFFAVGREGLETALFLWAAVQAAGSGTDPILGAALGLLVAVALAWLLYRRAVTINLARFFTVTGGLLIIVAAGVLAYGVHDLQEAGILPGLNALAFDVSRPVPPGSWYGTLLKGTVNFSPATTWLQGIAWLAYLIPVALLYFRHSLRIPSRPIRAPAGGPAPAPASAPRPTH